MSSELTVWQNGESSLSSGVIWEGMLSLLKGRLWGLVARTMAVVTHEVKRCIAETWESVISSDYAVGQRFWESQCWLGDPMGTSMASPSVF